MTPTLSVLPTGFVLAFPLPSHARLLLNCHRPLAHEEYAPLLETAISLQNLSSTAQIKFSDCKPHSTFAFLFCCMHPLVMYLGGWRLLSLLQDGKQAPWEQDHGCKIHSWTESAHTHLCVSTNSGQHLHWMESQPCVYSFWLTHSRFTEASRYSCWPTDRVLPRLGRGLN